MKQQHTLQPKVRFPEFEGDWKLTTIKEATNNHNNKRKPLKDSDRTDLDKIYPYYGASGIIDYVDEYLFDGEYLLLGEDGANIISRNSRLVFIAKGKFWVNNHAHVFSAKTNYDLRFLSDRLEYINYVIYNTGTAQPKLNSAVVANIEFNAPSLPEQQKIADYLATIDTKINLLEEKKAQLALYKKAMMQKLFSQEIRFKPSKAEALEAYPDWEEKRLGEVASITVSKNRLNLLLPVLTNSAEYGVINQEDFFDNQIANDKSLDTYIVLDKYEFVYNPRISKHAPYGPININRLTKGLLSPLYSVFKINEDLMSLDYVEYYFKTSKWYKYMAISGNQGARSDRMAVNKETLSNIPISKPCKAEQQKIADFLSTIDENIEKVNEQITQTQSFKKAMLQQMFV